MALFTSASMQNVLAQHGKKKTHYTHFFFLSSFESDSKRMKNHEREYLLAPPSNRSTSVECPLPTQPLPDSINSCSPIFTAGNKQVLAV